MEAFCQLYVHICVLYIIIGPVHVAKLVPIVY